MRLIDADALENLLGVSDKDIYCACLLREAPTIDAAPVVHARWIRKYDTLSQNYNSDKNWYFACSNCDGADQNRAKHCHCCGAQMDEPSEK